MPTQAILYVSDVCRGSTSQPALRLSTSFTTHSYWCAAIGHLYRTRSYYSH